MKPTKKCSGPNCNRHAVAKGLCTAHYGQRRRGRPLTELPTRAIKECAIEGCGRVDIQAKGMCALHYGRMLRGGAPGGAAPKAYRDPESAFAARTTREGECLVWTGSRDAAGYGQIWVNGKLRRAHRYAWERANGPIPEGMVIDHTCWNPPCVDVQHLRLARPMQNSWNLNGASVNSRSGIRNVWKGRDGYHVQVTRDGIVHTSHHTTIEAAAREAERLRADLFGDYAGR